jgi:F-type H+-transporting ATPase subunit b
MKKTGLFLAVLLLPFLALATGEHELHHVDGVPRVVLYQAINLIILFSALIYYTKDKIVAFFTQRKADYLVAAEKSASARQAAEREFHAIRVKIEQLDATRAETIAKANAHAKETQEQINAEAVSVSKRIGEEAKMTVQLEIQKAQRDLRHQLIADALEAARNVLTKDISAQDHQKLQSDFAQNIGGV